MTNQRKQIIINEITFWKKNKLLPEQYCDFLMTLYTEGEYHNNNDEVKAVAKQSVKGKERQLIRLKYMVTPIIAIAIIIALYIMTNPLFLLIIAFLFSVICIGFAIYYAKKNAVLTPLLQLTGALVLLFATMKVCLHYYPGNDMALYVTLISNCTVWLLSGLLMKLTYFSIAGGLGLLAILIYGAI